MAKNVSVIIIAVLLSLVLISSASAALEINNDNLEIDVSYEDLEDDDDELEINHDITIKNSGSASESVSVSLTSLTSKYDLKVEPRNLQIAANEQESVKITGKIPVNVDQGKNKFGKLKISGALEGEITKDLQTDVQSMLEVKKIIVKANGREVKSIDESGEEVKDLKPGDDIELRFQLRNLFDRDYDEGDIEGDIEITLDDNDFDNDIDEQEDFSIDAGERFESESSEIVFKFEVPNTAEDGEYDLEVKVDAKDDNKARYDLKWDVVLEVERERDDIRIESFTVSPSELSCTRDATVSVRVANKGEDRQRHSAVTVTSNDLDITFDTRFELDSGTSDDSIKVVEFPISIGSNVEPGVYPLTATAYYDFTTYGDRDSVNLVVKECSTSAPSNNEDTSSSDSSNESEQETQVSEPTTVTPKEGGEDTIADAVKVAFGNKVRTVEPKPYDFEDALVAAIVVALIIVLAFIVVLFVLLFK